MDIFAQMAQKIITAQESIIGPIAYQQASKVSGLTIDRAKNIINFTDDKTVVVEKLVKQYKSLFGQASVEACKEAVRSIIAKIPQDQVPPLLR